MPTEPTQAGPTLRSEFADDPEMADLVQMFVDDLPKRVAAVESAVHTGDAAVLQRLSHQLKGAAAGYGFPTIGQAAGRVEAPLRDAADPAAVLPSLRTEIHRLLTLCRAAQASTTPDA